MAAVGLALWGLKELADVGTEMIEKGKKNRRAMDDAWAVNDDGGYTEGMGEVGNQVKKTGTILAEQMYDIYVWSGVWLDIPTVRAAPEIEFGGGGYWLRDSGDYADYFDKHAGRVEHVVD